VKLSSWLVSSGIVICWYRINDQTGIDESALDVARVVLGRSNHIAVFRAPRKPMKAPTLIEVLDTACPEAGGSRFGSERFVRLEHLVILGPGPTPSRLHPLYIAGVRVQTIRDGNSQASSRSEVGLENPQESSELATRPVFHDVLRQDPVHGPWPEHESPMTPVERIQHRKVGSDPSSRLRWAGTGTNFEFDLAVLACL
jgi:hypothetical protein